MASYNAWNKVPMTANPIIRDVVVKEWGVDGIICTDAGSLGNMTRAHHYYPDTTHGAAGAIKDGSINEFLDQYDTPVKAALDQKLLTMADIDKVVKGVLRVLAGWACSIPPRNPYAKIGSEGPDPWTTQKSKDTVRLATQKSIVLLKNAENLLPLDKAKVKSIALIGPFANLVVPDWYSSQPPYMITPLAGVKAKVGEGVKVEYAAGKDVAAAAALAKASDVAILCVGNNPNLNNGWTKVNDSSEGAKHRPPGHYPRQRAGGPHPAGLRGQSQDRGRARIQFPLRHQLGPGARAGHPAHGPQQPGGGQCPGGRPVRRLQPGRPAGADLAQVARSTADDDGLRHS